MNKNEARLQFYEPKWYLTHTRNLKLVINLFEEIVYSAAEKGWKTQDRLSLTGMSY